MCMALLCTLTCITRECKKREETNYLTFKSMEVMWEGNKRQAAALESVLLGGCTSCWRS